MRRSEIYKIILFDIIDRLQSEGNISDDDATDKKAIINFTYLLLIETGLME